MTAKRLIRISAILILVHLLGHTGGHLSWDKASGPLFGVVKEMKSHSAEFMGATKSMADYFNGYSLIMFGLFGMSILVLWTLSNHTFRSAKLVKQILYPMGVTYLAFGVIEFLYFFPFAAIISLLAGILMLFSTLKLTDK
ncbi:hypothetical protein LZQ00_05655 [Sphingobacterium sp. SRCM116780]|uniref:LIC_13387 family protein n=1 Tax=Sphingobacterium sp. SRCM116780 TaxID=2907623 RepID=UPI001F25248C|nr:hypothetical protein [Sphingobacterium sp. SRCM116780]UIR57300.1 hypothetical protein LZQ00_05655 [Sphingobacterium sp. SRCM116780]